MHISGEVNQISTGRPKGAFLNLEGRPGMVGASSHAYKNPTFLWISGYSWGTKVFDTMEWAQEWIDSEEFNNMRITILYQVMENELKEYK